jgi:hypothetical protein
MTLTSRWATDERGDALYTAQKCTIFQGVGDLFTQDEIVF